MTDYRSFLASKRSFKPDAGFEIDPCDLNPSLKPFQADCVRYLLRRGAGAMFWECGLGKTIAQLEWAYQVAARTKGNILILCPLAVGPQTVREAERFQIGRGWMPVAIAKSQDDIPFVNGIAVTNYEKLSKFDPSRFAGVVLDESSVLKAFTGKTKQALCAAFESTPFKLACTATPAPNDQLELGNHSEFLGVLPSREMISRWFINDSMNAGKYRLKGHAEADFWDWVSSWAVSLETPADLGYPAPEYILPDLEIHEHEVDVDEPGPQNGLLFSNDVVNATSIHREKRRSVIARAEKVREVIYGQSTISQVVSREQASHRQGKEKSVPEELLPEEQEQVQENSRTASETQCNATGKIRKRPGIQGANQSDSQAVSHSNIAKEDSTEAIRTDAGTVAGDAGISEQQLQDLRSLGLVESESFPSCGSLPSDRNCSGTALRELQLCNRQSSGLTGSSQESSGLFREQWVIWCDTDYEQDALEAVLQEGDFVSIRGSDSEGRKITREEEWRFGKKLILLSKPEIFGHGLNWQFCHNMIFVGLSYSFERFYQSIRRMYRFGQMHTVHCHVVNAPAEQVVWRTVKRKEREHREMKRSMASAMIASQMERVRGKLRPVTYQPTSGLILPEWLKVKA